MIAKINNFEYTSLDDLRTDVDLMFRNTGEYNSEGSDVVADAIILESTFTSQWKSKLSGNSLSLPIHNSTFFIVGVNDFLQSVQIGDVKSVENALKNGFNPNSLGDSTLTELGMFMWSPVHCASFYAQRACLELLVEFGADIEALDTLYNGVSLNFDKAILTSRERLGGLRMVVILRCVAHLSKSAQLI